MPFFHVIEKTLMWGRKKCERFSFFLFERREDNSKPKREKQKAKREKLKKESEKREKRKRQKKWQIVRIKIDQNVPQSHSINSTHRFSNISFNLQPHHLSYWKKKSSSNNSNWNIRHFHHPQKQKKNDIKKNIRGKNLSFWLMRNFSKTIFYQKKKWRKKTNKKRRRENFWENWKWFQVSNKFIKGSIHLSPLGLWNGFPWSNFLSYIIDKKNHWNSHQKYFISTMSTESSEEFSNY